VKAWKSTDPLGGEDGNEAVNDFNPQQRARFAALTGRRSDGTGRAAFRDGHPHPSLSVALLPFCKISVQ
jgi:hypothetical protein